MYVCMYIHKSGEIVHVHGLAGGVNACIVSTVTTFIATPPLFYLPYLAPAPE